MFFCGVDPGLDGALAFVRDGEAFAHPMPVLDGGKRRTLDLRALADLLSNHDPRLVALEEVSPAPVRGRTQGTLSMFSFGRGLGQIEGVLCGLDIPYVLVKPGVWKQAILNGTARDKAAAVAWAQRRFPGVSLTPGKRRVAHDGIADALCLAEYARRNGRAE